MLNFWTDISIVGTIVNSLAGSVDISVVSIFGLTAAFLSGHMFVQSTWCAFVDNMWIEIYIYILLWYAPQAKVKMNYPLGAQLTVISNASDFSIAFMCWLW